MSMMQLVIQIVDRPLGPLEAIVDKESEVVSRGQSEYWQTRPLQTRRLTEKKVRQQVEQRLTERKQPKVQNWRGRLMRWRHASDDDPSDKL